MDLSIFDSLSPQIKTFFLAMAPITELRASIPIALESFGLPWFEAFIFSLVGNLIPAILIIIYIGPVSEKLSENYTWARKFFDWLFARTRNKFNHRYDRWGSWALLLFVAIPLPTTGVWTGSVAAWLFGIAKREALIYISLGALIAAVIVTLISLGLFSIIS